MNQIKTPLLGLLFLLLQTTLLNLLSIKGIKPDLVILFIIARALKEGPAAGVAWGFGMGLVLDSVTGGLAGLGALSYSVAGFIGGKIGPGNSLTPLRYLLIVTICSLVSYTIFTYFLQPWDVTGWFMIIFTHTLPGVLYTLFLALAWAYSPFSHFYPGKDHA